MILSGFRVFIPPKNLEIGALWNSTKHFQCFSGYSEKRKINKDSFLFYARITVDGARAECSVRRNVDPLHWDSEKEKAKDTFLEAPVLNEYLALVRAEIIKHTDFYGWRAGCLACLPYRALMKKFDDLV